MKKSILSTAVMLLLVGLYSSAQYGHENLKIKRSAEFSDAANPTPAQFDLSYSFENLRLYPIIANDAFREEHKDLGKFTLLKDAIEHDKIIITETGARHLANSDGTNQSNRDTTQAQEPINNLNNIQIQQVYSDGMSSGSGVSGTVNTLFAQNKSNDTIFIMAGEVVKGGKQDRVIGQDVVLAPGEKIDLSAFCVEKSRWTTKDNNGGEFTGYYNVSSMDIRKAVTEDQNQSKVWSTVDVHTQKNGADSDTKTYTNLENSEQYRTAVSNYMEKFKSAFGNDGRVIGVIAVTGDKVIGCDMFATHDLFIDSYVNLIHSYVGHAITKGSPVTIGNDTVFAYLDNILKNEGQQKEEIEKNGTVYEYKNKKLHITTYD
jgi:ARG and Rhodanese-Phosphatase-superfamily-associated Protein domain